MGVATIVANNVDISYGTKTVAAMVVATKIMMIGTFVVIGFSTGCQPITDIVMRALSSVYIKIILRKDQILKYNGNCELGLNPVLVKKGEHK